MRIINSLLMIILLAVCGVFLWHYNDSIGATISSWLHGNRDLVTFEVRYSPQQILEISKKKLVQDVNIIAADPSLFFRPYLMMRVKFPGNDGLQEEGILLWSLVDGEAVINGDTWEMTNGFSKMIVNHASSQDEFRLLEILSHHGGSMAKEALKQRLKMNDEHLAKLVKDAKEKHLLIEENGRYSLTFHSKIDIARQTHFSEPLATKVYSHALREEASFDKHQIEAIAVSAFGNSFIVEDSEEVYLPVYAIETRHKYKEGSRLTTYWNALTGKQLPSK